MSAAQLRSLKGRPMTFGLASVQGVAHDAPDSARARVRRGIAWLNANVKDWRKKIDVERLDAHRGATCPLAQAMGTVYFNEARNAAGLSDPQTRDFGFYHLLGLDTPQLIDNDYAALTRAWKSELRPR